MTTIDANNKPSAAVDTSNVIPFPGARAVHKQPAKMESRSRNLPLRQALRRIKDMVLCLARRPTRAGVQRKRASTSALAAQHAKQHRTPVLDHRGRAIRERVSA